MKFVLEFGILTWVIYMLICPICHEKLTLENKSMKCSHNHCFDIAKEGYLNLLRKNSTNHGDNKDMVLARRHFLEKDYYAPLRNRIIELLNENKPATILDLGCGEGYYTHEIALQTGAKVYGNDVSKEAIKLAAKKDKSIQYFIASSSDLPLQSSSMDCMTCIFSFYDFEECKRVLKENGKLLVVSPGPNHLIELKSAVYDTPYLNEVKPMDESVLKKDKEVHVSYTFDITNNEDIIELFGMTPYAFKTKISDRAKLDTLQELTLTADFVIQIYTK